MADFSKAIGGALAAILIGAGCGPNELSAPPPQAAPRMSQRHSLTGIKIVPPVAAVAAVTPEDHHGGGWGGWGNGNNGGGNGGWGHGGHGGWGHGGWGGWGHGGGDPQGSDGGDPADPPPDVIRLNGTELNGIRLNGSTLNGVTLDGVQLEGTALQAQLQGTKLETRDLAGATFVGELSNGMDLSIRVDSAQAPQNVNGSQIWLYSVSYSFEGSQWSPLCYDDNNNPVSATALAGTWDYSSGTPTGGQYIPPNPANPQFTFACVGAAIEKCVSFGYVPFAKDHGRSLQPYHQACTRMLRADYCGDGTPNTVDGTGIDIYDGLGLLTDTERQWPFEAEWDADGARCVASQREGPLDSGPPSCSLGHQFDVTNTCGNPSHFETGTLEMDKTLGVNNVLQ